MHGTDSCGKYAMSLSVHDWLHTIPLYATTTFKDIDLNLFKFMSV